MSKPAKWIVSIPGKPSQEFTQRRAMRDYVATLRASGHSPKTTPVFKVAS